MREHEQNNILNECRQLMTKHLRVLITSVLNDVDDKLLHMAEEPDVKLDESDCYEAVREIRLKRTEIKLRFERRLINLFENEVRATSEVEGKEFSDEDETQKLFQFSDNGKSRKITIEESTGEIRKTCAQLLMELDKNFSRLMSVEGNINPLQPEMIFEAFREACCDIKSGDEVRLIMFEIFETRIGNELNDIYQNINTLLTEEIEMENKNVEESVTKIEQSAADEQKRIMLKYEMINIIERRLDGKKTPDFVRNFLLKHWCLFLEETCLQYSENSIAWNAARQTMDDLIQNVSPMLTLYDRERQIQLLPSLLFRLLNGMKLISMGDLEIELFLKKLKSCQLESLNMENNNMFENLANEIEESISKYELHN
jgi:hypothetical protein